MKILLIHIVLSYGNATVELDAEAEKRLRWKIDLYVVPTVSLLYLFCYIDRANIGLLHCLVRCMVANAS